jgi:probable addiction module antidote protein
MKEEITPFVVSDYIQTHEDAHFLLEAAFESGSADDVKHALRAIASARSLTSLAKDAGLSKQALHHALSEKGNPTLVTLLSLIKALNLKVEFKAI